MSLQPAVVTVRAQAHGGKYIGPAVAKAPVLSVFVDGTKVIENLTIPNKESGTVVQEQGPTTSPYPIVVQSIADPNQYYPTPGPYWLEPPADGDADVVVTLPLLTQSTVEFRVEGFSPTPVYGSVTAKLVPGCSYTIVVQVAGLYTPSFTAMYVPSTGRVDVTATVQMMCGCPITQQPRNNPVPVEQYWPSNEFDVQAIFFRMLPPPLPPFLQAFPLECKETDQFNGSPKLPSGTYEVILSAVQKGAMNTGSAVAQVTVP